MDHLRALLFGVTLAAAVGPIALIIVRSGMIHGLRIALASALGVALADLSYGVIAFGAGASAAATLSAHRRLFELAASGLLLALGSWLTRGALRRGSVVRPDDRPTAAGLLPTYLLTLANPLTILLFVGFSGQLDLARGWGDALVLASLVFCGSLPVQAVYALFGASVQRFVRDPRHVRALNAASGIGIAAFGAYGLARAL